LKQIPTAELTNDWNSITEQFSQIFIASEKIIPLDLIPCCGTLLGTKCVIAQSVASNPSEIQAILLKSLKDEKIPLRRVAHVSTYYPGETPLYDVDVIAATLKIDNRFAVEHYIYPTSETAKNLFGRTDIDILHIESHGMDTSLQIDNPYGEIQDVRKFSTPDGPCTYFFLGCEVGKHIESVSPFFVKKGAKATLGSYSKFLSGVL
jgi:hypothetical protein